MPLVRGDVGGGRVMLPRGSLAIGGGTPAHVVTAAAHAFGVNEDELTGPRRHYPLVVYRQTAMAAARMLGHSFPRIALAFGHRNHTTVMHACERVAADADLNRRARLLADSIISEPGSLF